MNADQPTILDLPNEILEIIFSHLSFNDRMSVTLVCRRWSEFRIPLSELCLNLISCLDASIFEEFLATDRPYRHLKLRHNSYTSMMISKFHDSLETLEVEDVYMWDWMNALCGLPKLHYLGMKCPNISAITNLSSSRPCPSMRSLVIDECDQDDFASLNSFISETFPRLTSLRLREFSGNLSINCLPDLEILEANKISILHENLPDLRTITITNRRLESGFLERFLHSDNIRTVKTEWNVSLVDDKLLQLTEVFPRMTSFKSRWSMCSAGGIEAAQRKLPNCTFDVGPASGAMEFEFASDLEDSYCTFEVKPAKDSMEFEFSSDEEDTSNESDSS